MAGNNQQTRVRAFLSSNNARHFLRISVENEDRIQRLLERYNIQDETISVYLSNDEDEGSVITMPGDEGIITEVDKRYGEERCIVFNKVQNTSTAKPESFVVAETKTETRGKCHICRKNDVDCQLIKCGHIANCKSCIETYKDLAPCHCPICGEENPEARTLSEDEYRSFLKEELERLAIPGDPCTLCCDSAINVRLSPCGHKFCTICANKYEVGNTLPKGKIRRCPDCQVPISGCKVVSPYVFLAKPMDKDKHNKSKKYLKFLETKLDAESKIDCVPGLGMVFCARLKKKGHKTACSLLKEYKKFKKENKNLNKWLIDLCTPVHPQHYHYMDMCLSAFKDYCAKFEDNDK